MMDYDQLVESNKGTIQALMIANRRADTAEARAKRAETNAGDLQQYADCLAEKHATLAAEVERLRAAEESANHDAARLVYEVARLGIAYEGDDPLARLVEEIASLREQLDAAPVRFIDGRGYRVIPTEWWTGVGVSFEPPAPRQE